MGSKFCGGAIQEVIDGDREYYCSTMLTFFKPWELGRSEIRRPKWDDAFGKTCVYTCS